MDDFIDKNDGDDRDKVNAATSDGDAQNVDAGDSTDKEDKSSISSDLIRGHINTIILRSLYERDKYGYEIISDIERKSHNQYSLKQPTLYSALKRLESQGYILAYWKSDEVSSGGRRKYFTLTDSGREITEKNLAEWEYSRTIIDSLISDRSFDFTQPAPTPVDFSILRNSVSRVPVVKDEDKAADAPESAAYTPPAPQEIYAEPYQAPPVQQAQPQPVQPPQQPMPQPVQQQPPQPQSQAADQTAGYERISAEDLEARRRAHENYLKLISEPIAQSKPATSEVDVVPNSDNINTDRILYNVKSEAERDYKNLINGIYQKALVNGRVEADYGSEKQQRTSQPKKPAAQTVIIDRGKTDGVRVTPSTEYDTRTTYATKTTYNKGLTFAISSAAVLFILLVEFMFCMIFRSKLGVPVIYPVTLLIIGLVQFAIFGGLFLKGYGANCTKPMSNAYISKCVVITIILILIICVCSFLFNINFTVVSDIMKLLVIPIITALNIVVFAIVFYLQVK